MGKFNKGASTNFLHMVSDFCFMIVSFIIATLVARISFLDSLQIYAQICLAFMLVFMLANKDARIYNITTFFYVDRIISYVTRSFLIAVGISALLIYFYICTLGSSCVM